MCYLQASLQNCNMERIKVQREHDNFRGKTREVNFFHLLYSFGGGGVGACGIVDVETM